MLIDIDEVSTQLPKLINRLIKDFGGRVQSNNERKPSKCLTPYECRCCIEQTIKFKDKNPNGGYDDLLKLNPNCSNGQTKDRTKQLRDATYHKNEKLKKTVKGIRSQISEGELDEKERTTLEEIMNSLSQFANMRFNSWDQDLVISLYQKLRLRYPNPYAADFKSGQHEKEISSSDELIKELEKLSLTFLEDAKKLHDNYFRNSNELNDSMTLISGEYDKFLDELQQELYELFRTSQQADLLVSQIPYKVCLVFLCFVYRIVESRPSISFILSS